VTLNYKFYFWDYLKSLKISAWWALEQGISFNSGVGINERYAILNEYQAIMVRLRDPNVTIAPIEE